MMTVNVLAEWLVTSIEVILYFTVLHTLAEEQFPHKKHRILFLAVSAVIASGILLLNFVNLSISFATQVYSMFALALGACILYQGKFGGFLSMAIIYITGLNLVEGSFLTCMKMMGLGDLVLQMQSGFHLIRIYILIAFKVIDITIVVCLCFLLKKYSVKLKASPILLICSVLCFTGVSVWQMNLLEDLNWKPDILQAVLGISLVFIGCTVYFYYRLREVNREKAYAAQQALLLEQNYQTAQEAYESNAKLYHDMRNHFALLQAYITEGKISDAKEYLQKLSSMSESAIERHTGIDAVDYILSQKAEYARRQDIEMQIHAEYPKDCAIDPVDLCTILTNLLDNAIEACTRQQENKKRNLSVTMRRIHQFIILRISNTSESAPVIRNGKLITSKQDSLQHGWGIQSVETAVKKYQGTMKYEYSNSIFTVSVMLFYQ